LEALRSIQDGTLRYEYRGRPCLKDPFDLALYQLLLGRTSPRTIIELGTHAGGSALWFADQMRILELAPNVITLDIESIATPDMDGVTCVLADVHALADSALPELLGSAPRPFLVVDDGPHTVEAVGSALSFFHGYLQPGEYIVVEDGICFELGYSELDDGPNRAMTRFLSDHPDSYVIDRSYCDYYGVNVTWNTNGYLRRL
jgi:cephalosporin hydroxylase